MDVLIRNNMAIILAVVAAITIVLCIKDLCYDRRRKK